MIINIINYFLVFLFFGFLPIFLILHIYKINKKIILISSIGLAPILIALTNSLCVVFHIQHSFLVYIIPLIINSVILYILKKKNKFPIWSFNEVKKFAKPLIIGVLFGIGYWLIFFYNFYLHNHIYVDTLNNYGIM